MDCDAKIAPLGAASIRPLIGAILKPPLEGVVPDYQGCADLDSETWHTRFSRYNALCLCLLIWTMRLSVTRESTDLLPQQGSAAIFICYKSFASVFKITFPVEPRPHHAVS